MAAKQSTRKYESDAAARAACAHLRGVVWIKRRGNFRAMVDRGGERVYLGAFDTPEDAAAALVSAGFDPHEKSRAADLWGNAVRDASTGCLVWQRSKTKAGYGSVTRGNVSKMAHREAYQRYRGLDDAEMARIERVDHICMNPSCIEPFHLRAATHKENIRYRSPRRGLSSVFKGVSWCQRRKAWGAYIGANGKTFNLGRFDSEEDAARAYDEAAVRLFGEFALTNAMLIQRGEIDRCL